MPSALDQKKHQQICHFTAIDMAAPTPQPTPRPKNGVGLAASGVAAKLRRIVRGPWRARGRLPLHEGETTRRLSTSRAAPSAPLPPSSTPRVSRARPAEGFIRRRLARCAAGGLSVIGRSPAPERERRPSRSIAARSEVRPARRRPERPQFRHRVEYSATVFLIIGSTGAGRGADRERANLFEPSH
jgi:hypothetical protein